MNYPEPEKFIPERFMDTGLETAEFLDPRIFAFGYGRRWVTDFKNKKEES